jgi:cbb3-type cytochrome oxidase maturation protein
MGIFSIITLISTLLFFGLISLFVWSVRSGQLDDLETPSNRALWDDPQELPTQEKKNAN